MHPSWQEILRDEFDQPYMKALQAFLVKENVEGRAVFPPLDQVFEAFTLTSFQDARVVILGQDPYHGEGQAHGLSFSVPRGVLPPPSLKNIYKELSADLGIPRASHGCLEAWARQGILLLNEVLTVRKGRPQSHKRQGWELFTDKVLELLLKKEDPLVFMLWGKSALEKFRRVSFLIKPTHHLILATSHPSPLSAYSGFLGCRHFSKTNAFLELLGKQLIDWTIC